MSKDSFTVQDHGNNSKNQAVSAAGALTDPGKDFVIMCPFLDKGLDEAILALYYLPPQFKLKVLIDASTAHTPFTGHEAVKGRISVETEAGRAADASPFVNANAVVYSENTPVKSESAMPRVVISNMIGDSVKNTDGSGFTISENSPEALASAMLSIAKFANA